MFLGQLMFGQSLTWGLSRHPTGGFTGGDAFTGLKDCPVFRVRLVVEVFEHP